VEHSLSPRIFQWLGANGPFRGEYAAWRVAPSDLPVALGALREGRYQGLSVTLPHKERVVELVDEVEPAARSMGAANCLALGDGRVKAFNTDAGGLGAALAEHGFSLKDAKVVVLGAGGGARAAVYESVRRGAASVAVANRHASRAAQLAAPFRPVVRDLALVRDELAEALEGADLLINATSVGLNAKDESPLPEGLPLREGLFVMDMVYRPIKTALLRRAEGEGARTVDGLWMLIHQALQQLHLWTGYEAPKGVAPRLYAHLREGLT
jgi:shikimate dehydrogenase